VDTIVCPKCGTENPADATNCSHCRVNLRFAAEHPAEIERAKLEARLREERALEQAASRGPPSLLARVGLGALCLLVGAFAIIPLFIIGEGTGSGVLGYAVISLIFALVAFALARRDPGAWWAYALLLCAPITVLSVFAAAADYVVGAVLMIAIAIIGGYFGTQAG
jgi:ribosomal protein L40E